MTIFLETERLILKPPTLLDLKHWKTVQAQAHEIVLKQLQDSIAEYKKNGFSICSLFLKNNFHFIGKAGLFYYDSQHDIEMSCGLHKAYWNQGYATEVSKALIDWGFKNLSIKKLTALTRSDNNKSKKILEKVGMLNKQIVLINNEQFLLYEIATT